jgi:hypothetical protein
MTDRIKGLTVALTHDIREDDCQSIIDAIKMVKGVEGVETHVAGPMDYIAKQQVKSELRDKIFEWFKSL